MSAEETTAEGLVGVLFLCAVAVLGWATLFGLVSGVRWVWSLWLGS